MPLSFIYFLFQSPFPTKHWSVSIRDDPSTMTAIHPTTERVFDLVQIFYDNNPQIQASHGLKSHVLVVHYHAVQAVRACHPPLSAETAMEIEVAALLHDVDDEKYFPKKNTSSSSTARYPNAESILRQAGLSPTSTTHGKSILFMIQLVSCSQNGNRVPPSIIESGDYHYLIPRWADRIEAVGTKGVLRCYQYNREHGHALWSRHSPRPQSETEMWQYATPERFQAYQDRSGTSEDMISHYYDKLLVSGAGAKDDECRVILVM